MTNTESILNLQLLEDMERITWSNLCDNIAMIFARINAENIGFVILDESGKESLVVCPVHWIEKPEELE